ncbi:hypothetical protein SLEP1_g17802 [Rubroshorea leprosula]|uniref:Uncharacterized protein n=1 Tax=Rubroshorea leprosula TaxID=152421 RepID=A0AAV5J4M6_9ROSI|nr:hypothetical protein SLEP1_g17802 [Rubroshorea leprosula]
MGACWSNRIKAVNNSNTGVNSKIVSRDGNNLSVSGSKVSSSSVPQTPRSEGEILQSSNLKNFSFNELRTATRNFRPDSMLGEGGFGSVFKGWIDEHSLIATKPGTGIVIAVKRLNQEGFQGDREWMVSFVSDFLASIFFIFGNAVISASMLFRLLLRLPYNLGEVVHTRMPLWWVLICSYCLTLIVLVFSIRILSFRP